MIHFVIGQGFHNWCIIQKIKANLDIYKQLWVVNGRSYK